jgi:hypothetical protein
MIVGLRYVIGLQRVIRNLRTQHALLGPRFMRGAKRAGLRLMRESQRLVPVEFGPLKNSAYTRAVGVDLSGKVYIGYTAAYASYVHEQVQEKLRGRPRPSGRGLYWDPAPQARSKFLEAPARAMAPRLRQDILREMRVT